MATKVQLDATTKYMPFLVEIRRRLLFLLVFFVVASILGFIYYERIIKIILGIFHFEGVNIVFTSPFQFINLAINSSLIVGLVAILPVIIVQVLAFLKPALAKQEYKTIVYLLPFSLFLLLVGFSYGMMAMRSTLGIFYRQSVSLGVGNFLDISAFLSQTLITAILLGVAFQFPIVLTVLLRFKVIDRPALTKFRPLAYCASLIFAAFLPPTDLFSLVLLFLPLAILFELTLILNRLLTKIT